MNLCVCLTEKWSVKALLAGFMIRVHMSEKSWAWKSPTYIGNRPHWCLAQNEISVLHLSPAQECCAAITTYLALENLGFLLLNVGLEYSLQVLAYL